MKGGRGIKPPNLPLQGWLRVQPLQALDHPWRSYLKGRLARIRKIATEASQIENVHTIQNL